MWGSIDRVRASLTSVGSVTLSHTRVTDTGGVWAPELEREEEEGDNVMSGAKIFLLWLFYRCLDITCMCGDLKG